MTLGTANWVSLLALCRLRWVLCPSPRDCPAPPFPHPLPARPPALVGTRGTRGGVAAGSAVAPACAPLWVRPCARRRARWRADTGRTRSPRALAPAPPLRRASHTSASSAARLGPCPQPGRAHPAPRLPATALAPARRRRDKWELSEAPCLLLTFGNATPPRAAPRRGERARGGCRSPPPINLLALTKAAG